MQFGRKNMTKKVESRMEQIEISFTGEKINEQYTFLQIYIQGADHEKKLKLKTKITKGSDPTYFQKLQVQHYFEIKQVVFIEVSRCSCDGQNVGVVGTAQTTIGQIVSNFRQKGIQVKINKSQGFIYIRCKLVSKINKRSILFHLQAKQLSYQESSCWSKWFSTTTATPISFFKFNQIKENSLDLLFQSKSSKLMNDQIIQIRQSDSPDQIFSIEYYEEPEALLIGSANITINQINTCIKDNKQLTIALTRNGERKGQVCLSKFKPKIRHGFLDFLREGMKIGLQIYIDFTSSNKMYKDPTSNHYLDTLRNKDNKYQIGIREVSTILLDYDEDKLVPCYGFGASVSLKKLNSNNNILHYFPLNGDFQNPNFFKIEGIMDGYKDCLPMLVFSSPTYMGPLIEGAILECQSYQQKCKEIGFPPNQYKVLLILTDGAIHDKQDVINLLIKCARLPISIIIIGIGNGYPSGWSIMHQLDNDDNTLVNAQGDKPERDLVQFVEFEKYKDNADELAKEVLEELPYQVQKYHELIERAPIFYHPVIDLKKPSNWREN